MQHHGHSIDKLNVIVMVYTRKASFNIAFNITFKYRRHYHSFWFTLGSCTRLTHLNLKIKVDNHSKLHENLRLVMFDKVFINCANMLLLVNACLCAIKCASGKPFEGVKMIMCGCLFQASPMKDQRILAY